MPWRFQAKWITKPQEKGHLPPVILTMAAFLGLQCILLFTLANANKERERSQSEQSYARQLKHNHAGSRHMSPGGPRDAWNWDYGTHTTPLLTAVLSTTGDVLELGCGDFSTPMLDTVLSKMPGRKLYTAEGDATWLKHFKNLESSWHVMRNVPAFQMSASFKSPLPRWMKRKWGLVFVDQAPAKRRRRDIKRLRKSTQVFVVHDTSAFVEHIYNLEETLSSFKYRYIYPRYLRTTTLVSDHIDVRKWFAGLGDPKGIGNSDRDNREPIAWLQEDTEENEAERDAWDEM